MNLTALPAGGAPSHLRIYPYLAVFPTVAFLSYTTVNLSNAGIVAMCPGICAFDVTIYNATTVNYALDVMGFFYRATENPLGLSQTSATTTIGAGCTNYAGGNVSITVPGPGYITVTAQARMRNFTAGNIYGLVYIGSTAVDCTFASAAQGYVAQVFALGPSAVAPIPEISVPMSRTFFVGGAGTYTYYLNGLKQLVSVPSGTRPCRPGTVRNDLDCSGVTGTMRSPLIERAKRGAFGRRRFAVARG